MPPLRLKGIPPERGQATLPNLRGYATRINKKSGGECFATAFKFRLPKELLTAIVAAFFKATFIAFAAALLWSYAKALILPLAAARSS